MPIKSRPKTEDDDYKSDIKSNEPITNGSLSTPIVDLSQLSWEEVDTEFKTRASATVIFGPTDSGRTHLALTAPGPIAYLHSYEKVDGQIQEARKSKIVKVHKFGGILRGNRDQVQQLAEIEVQKFEYFLSEAYKWARSIIIDTESKLWEIYQLAKLGSLSRAQRSEEDNKKGQLIYTEINARWTSMLTEYRVRLDNPLQNRQTNLILICKTTDEYKKVLSSTGKSTSVATGKEVRKSQKETGYFADVILRTYCKDDKKKGKEFSAIIEKPWMNNLVRGEELEDEMLDFSRIMAMITETDEEEWQ